MRRILAFILLLLLSGSLLYGQSLSVSASSNTYSNTGGSITLTVRLAYPQSLSTVGIEIGSVPPGWTFGELGEGNLPGIAPPRGLTGKFEFAYLSVPTSPITFTFTANYGAGLAGNQTFDGIRAVLRDSAGGSATNVSASPIVFAPIGGSPGGAVAPVIASQPLNTAVIAGQATEFRVIATGTAPLTYQWRKDGVTIGGATGPTLNLANVTSAAAGSYSVLVSNAAGSALSANAVLTVTAAAIAPTIVTELRDFSGLVGSAVTLAVTATGTAPLSYQWRKDGAAISGATSASLRLSGLSAESGSYSVTITNTAGSASSSPAVVRFTEPAVPLAITQQPVGQTINAGANATLTVGAAGTGTLTYQWFKDDVSLAGQVGAQLLLANVTAATAGNYYVEISRDGTRLRSAVAPITVNGRPAAPVIALQPTSTAALAGGSAKFAVTATGSPAPTFHWRKNGVAINAASTATLDLVNVQSADVGGYDVVVRNSVGEVTSSLAQLTVLTAPMAPVITRQPAAVSAEVGRGAALSVAAMAAPAATYQWFKDGASLPGASGEALVFSRLTTADAGFYSVVVTNAAGSTPSQAVRLAVVNRSFAGTYFGTLGIGGNFALRIREDNTGVLLAFAPASRVAYQSTTVTVDEQGRFEFPVAVWGNAPARAAQRDPAAPDEVGKAAAEDQLFKGSIDVSGAVTGEASGTTHFAFSGVRAPATGTTASLSGYYQASAAGVAAQVLAIVGPSGQAFALTSSEGQIDGGAGTVDTAGRLSLTTAGQQQLVLNVAGETGTIAGTVSRGGTTLLNLAGHAETASGVAEQRLVNISARTTAGNADAVAIVGFVISGGESKPVLIRAVGPALVSFDVAGRLPTPRLELVRNGVTLATNTGWSSAGNVAEISAATSRAGAFALELGSADSAILTTLAPGNYSAVVSAMDQPAGVVLVEVYDLSGVSIAQRLSNISTRAMTGPGDATLITGFVVNGTAPKRVLIRAAGPALAIFDVAGAVSRPVLRIFSGEKIVAQNAGWSVSVDSSAIAEAFGKVGAFAFPAGSNDAAIVVNLAPGDYTAQVSDANDATGIALLELYEVP